MRCLVGLFVWLVGWLFLCFVFFGCVLLACLLCFADS